MKTTVPGITHTASSGRKTISLQLACMLLGFMLFRVSAYSQCTAISAAYTGTYSTQGKYIPTLNDPLITVKLTYHIFNDGLGNGYTLSDPTMTYMVNNLTDGFQRYSAQRNATYMSGFIPPFTANFGGLMDSRVRYEITNVYVYSSPSLYTATNGQTLINHINSVNPNRINEGMPVMFNGASFNGYTGYASAQPNGLPYVHTSAGPGQGYWNNQHLLHEIGHVMGWNHTYVSPLSAGELGDNPCGVSNDFLSDVFPQNNPMCAANPNCNTCPEDANNYSNNVMNANPIPLDNNWMSPLQMARRIRSMHLKTYNNVRYYAKDVKSDYQNPWYITGNETWDFDIQMYRDIVVTTGNTLRITCKVAMATDGKIIVQKGAKLVIEGNGEVTGWCKKTPAGANFNMPLWTGIELEGSPLLSQTINNATGYCTNQGVVELKTGGTISYAYKGISTGRTSGLGAWQNNSSGGIVLANNANFYNNVFDIIFYRYQQGNERSRVNNCVFKTTAEIGRFANNTQISPKEHIKLYENRALVIKGCLFEYAAGNTYVFGNRGMGLYTTDSQFGVEPSTTASNEFKNLTMGIYIDNFNPIYTGTIRNTIFTSNQLAVKVENCHYLSFYENTVNSLGGDGVYLYRSKYYNIRNNIFTGTSYSGFGITAFESYDGAHFIYRNTFKNLQVGILCEDDNGGENTGEVGLKMNCNVFNSGVYNMYDIAVRSVLIPPVIMKEQSIASPTSAAGYVRNQYGAPYFPGYKNKFHVDWNNTQQIIHSCQTTGATNPGVNQSSSQVSLLTYAHVFNFATHCPQNPSSFGGNPGNSKTQKLSLMNEYLGVLVANPNKFERQITVASKMGVFLADSLPGSGDSIVAIMQNNQGLMDDADIQLVYAHLRNENYATAATKIAALPGSRDQWAQMLTHISALKQYDNGVNAYFAIPDNMSFMTGCINNNRDGKANAEAILAFLGIDHDYPVRYPDNITFPKTGQPVGLNSVEGSAGVLMYPNPAQTAVTIENLPAGEGDLKIEMLDVIGRIVYSNTISNPAYLQIPLSGISEGVYMLVVMDSQKNIVYQNKLIKN